MENTLNEIAEITTNDQIEATADSFDAVQDIDFPPPLVFEDEETNTSFFQPNDENEELIETGMSAAKISTLKSILKNIQTSINSALSLIDNDVAGAISVIEEASATLIQPTSASSAAHAPRPFIEVGPDDRVVEGVFDGEKMVGGDGKEYIVPTNYASKSKLVEGDLLKLTIGGRGNFIYKQIGPMDRQRISGSLSYDQAASQFIVLAAGRSWRVLKASVTYFKGEAGDEAVILVPKNAPSRWAAVENVIKRNPLLTVR